MVLRIRLLFTFLFLAVVQFSDAKNPSRKEIDSINNLPFDYKIANTSKVIRLTLSNVENAARIKYKKGMAEAYSSLGLLYYYQGKYDRNTFCMLKAMRLFEKENDMPALIRIYGEYGYQLKRRNMEQASFYMNKAMKLGKLHLKEAKLNAIYDNYGVLKEMQHDLDSALFFYNKALKLKEVAKDSFAIPYSLNKIAMVRIMQKKFSEAKMLLDKSYAMRVRLNDKVGIAENLNFYGHYFKSLGDKQQAIKCFTEALELSEKHQYNHLTQENYQMLSEIYEENKAFENALQFFKNGTRYKDSIQDIAMQTRQAELDIEYDTERKEKEILIQKAGLAEKNLWLLGIGSLLVFSILLGSLVYSRQRGKNKQLLREKELKEALQQIEIQHKLQEQRLAISRDLHDNIGAQLTFVISSVDNLKYGFSIENEKLKDRLSDISGFTKNTIGELRDTIWAMNKNEISFSDLKTRIANFIGNAKISAHGAEFEFRTDTSVSDTVTFSSLKGINLYRVIQEAVNNSIKYAEATRIDVCLTEEYSRFAIIISDNGNGFDVKNAAPGNGLENMRKRIEEIGGQIFITSEINKGTIVKVQFS
ncbi:tetratricopeptide repeat protein [Flavobacterium enshiense]|uniref:tetratricopeptide repeat-containing sensor histidine kinase n=1 Tax=Flavobacterium enshiense TaxID=1341165 RepID=UPI00345D5506